MDVNTPVSMSDVNVILHMSNAGCCIFVCVLGHKPMMVLPYRLYITSFCAWLRKKIILHSRISICFIQSMLLGCRHLQRANWNKCEELGQPHRVSEQELARFTKSFCNCPTFSKVAAMHFCGITGRFEQCLSVRIFPHS